MAEAVVSIALETLRDLLLEEVRFLAGVRSEVKTLESQLKEIKSFLKDAHTKRHKSDIVRGWIREIRDLAYRSEDAIETYAARRGRRRRGRLLRRCSCTMYEGFSLHQIGTEISEIKSEIARVTKSMQDYGIRRIIEGESSAAAADDNQQWKRRTFPFESEDVFVGKDQELEKLVSLVVDEEEHRVISVWGMGGIGKTTLARKVYNHDKTKRFFESFVWVCISQQCQIRSVLEDVLKQLNPERRGDNSSNLNDTELIRQLCEIQKAKRCMVVLDDIWKIDHWEGFKHAFLLRGSKSKILLTTRNQNVANIGYAFEAGLLTVDDGWKLLKKKAFPHSSVPDFQFEEKLLEKIGKEMVGKCGKLPLAISLLGGILSKKKSMREWELVNENISSYLYRGGGLENEKNEIHGVLNLSYQELPYYLKSCFLYMGRYMEDEVIGANELCLKWIAQGMISHENQPKEDTLLDIAQHYLSELGSRCIVNIEGGDPIRGHTHRSCNLHDAVRELCLSMGKEEDFGLQILDYEGGKFSLHEHLSRAKTRHLVVNFKRQIGVEREGQEFTITCDEETTKLERSLQFSNAGKAIEIPHSIFDLKKFKLLKVLVFYLCQFERRKLPREIGNLIHLRYLQVALCRLDELPSSISNLVYLHTLDLQNMSRIIRIPNILHKMVRLKHLFLPYFGKEIGSYRVRLEGLDELETLCGFDSLVHELKCVTKMKNLRRFEGEIHDSKSLWEIMDAISTNWNKLRSCGLEIRKNCHFTELMNFRKLLSCPNLHYLKIYVPIGNKLQELGNQVCTSNIVFLTLQECEIEEDPMEILGKLPVLEDLRLYRRSFVGEEMTCHAFGFPRLKMITIEELPNLREWRVEEGAMPLVSEITIRNCPRLEMLPDGLRFIDSLNSLLIVGMPVLGKRVSDEGGEDFDKVRHVPNIDIYPPLSPQ